MKRNAGNEFLELWSALARGLRALAAQQYAALDLGTTQAKFLREIGRNAPLSQADLARATATDPTLTGRALQTLLRRGWVRRKRSTEDRRQYVLELSAAGERLLARVERERERIAARVFAVLGARDRADFERVARKLLEALGSGGDPDPSRSS